MGKTDDLWKFGPVKGWGGPWWEETVQAGVASDPFLMTGFVNKCLHITHDAGHSVKFKVQLDFQGDGKFHDYATIETDAYFVHTFPIGLSAHWVRIVPDASCNASAQFHYT